MMVNLCGLAAEIRSFVAFQWTHQYRINDHLFYVDSKDRRGIIKTTSVNAASILDPTTNIQHIADVRRGCQTPTMANAINSICNQEIPANLHFAVKQKTFSVFYGGGVVFYN